MNRNSAGLVTLLCVLPLTAIAGCGGGNDSGGPSPQPTATTPPADGPGVNILGVTSSGEIVSFNSNSPNRLINRRRITGVLGGEQLIGIDYRPANRVPYLSSTTRLYRFTSLNSATVQPVGAPYADRLAGTSFGFDFNPVPDRIRLVSDTDQNLRINPDTGALVDADPTTPGRQPDGSLAFATGDLNEGRNPNVVGAAYSNNAAGATTTTNFVIDSGLDILATQGSLTGVTPAVSPNSGQLFTVGALGVDVQNVVGFDIGGTQNVGYIAAVVGNGAGLNLLSVNLTTGRATTRGRIGAVGDNLNLIGITVQP